MYNAARIIAIQLFFMALWAFFARFTISDDTTFWQFVGASIVIVFLFSIARGKSSVIISLLLILCFGFTLYITKWWIALINIPLTAGIASGVIAWERRAGHEQNDA